ncbi:MAG: AMED_5909 family protein [Pseudonocardiaceae bacterium]
MTEDKTAKPGPPTTLMQAREELVRLRPGQDASLAAWLAFYQRAAALYAELAESDRVALYAELAQIDHHRECLY